MPREMGGVVDGGMEGGCMGGGTRWKKMGRLGGGITGWMAPEWRAEEMAGPCSCKDGGWLGAEAGWAGWTGNGGEGRRQKPKHRPWTTSVSLRGWRTWEGPA